MCKIEIDVLSCVSSLFFTGCIISLLPLPCRPCKCVLCLWWKRIIWKINCSLLYCGYCQQSLWSIKKTDIGSKCNKGAANRLRWRAKERRRNTGGRVRQEEGNTKAERERGRKWNWVRDGERGFRRESEQKKNGMELDATVALLYLNGKMWI